MRFLILLLCLLPVSIYGYSVKLSNDTIYVDQLLTTTLLVENPATEFKAIEVMIKHRDHTLEGQEILTPTTSFRVIPEQFILMPNKEQSVIIQWLGSRTITKELPYRIIVQEVPIQKPKSFDTDPNASQANVTLSLRFVNSLYVRPKKASAKLEAVGPLLPSQNKMLLTLHNKGSAHEIVKAFKLKLTDRSNNDTSLNFDAKSFTIFNILPGEMRQIPLMWPHATPTHNIQSIYYSPL